jgi:hypothetical protein
VTKRYEEAVSRVNELTKARDEKGKANTNLKARLESMVERLTSAQSAYSDLSAQLNSSQLQVQAALEALAREKDKLAQAEAVHLTWQEKSAAAQAELIKSESYMSCSLPPLFRAV